MNNGRTLFIHCAGNMVLDRYNEVNSVGYYWTCNPEKNVFGVGNSVRAILSIK